VRVILEVEVYESHEDGIGGESEGRQTTGRNPPGGLANAAVTAGPGTRVDELGEHGALLVEHPKGAEAGTAERARRFDDETQQNRELNFVPQMKSGVEGSRERGRTVVMQR
jgi:hypothetical protein